jgi:hypothetical protein
VRNGLGAYSQSASRSADALKSRLSGWLGTSTGGGGLLVALASPYGVAAGGLGFAVLGLLLLRRMGFGLWPSRRAEDGRASAASVVEFYGRMAAALEAKGVRRRRADETPLEFAQSVGDPDVLKITQAYHRVRYGARPLSKTEAAEVERCLERVERENR